MPIETNDFSGGRKKTIYTVDDLVEVRNQAGDVIFTFDATLKKLILPTESSLEDETGEPVVGEGGGGGEVSVLKSATVTLTDAQIKALPTTPVQVVPAPGAGKMLWLIYALAFPTFTVAYDNVNEYPESMFAMIFLASENRAAGRSIDANDILVDVGNGPLYATFPALGSAVATPGGGGNVLGDTYYVLDLLINAPIHLRLINALGNLTGGDPANTMKVVTFYVEVTV